MAEMFLTKEELVTLTGRTFKRLQIQQLRKMGLPFFVNAIGHPIVARSAIEGKPTPPEQPKSTWVPNVLKGRSDII